MSSPVLDRWVAMAERHRRRQLHFAERTAGWLPSWRTRQRRQLVVAFFGAVLLVALVAAVLPVLGLGNLAGWTGLGYPLAVLVALGIWFVLRVVTSHVADLSRHVLDEREVALRQMSRAAGFVVTLWLAFVVLVYLIVLTGVDRSPDADAVLTAQLLLSFTVFTGACTPTVVLAWSLPDEEADQ